MESVERHCSSSSLRWRRLRPAKRRGWQPECRCGRNASRSPRPACGRNRAVEVARRPRGSSPAAFFGQSFSLRPRLLRAEDDFVRPPQRTPDRGRANATRTAGDERALPERKEERDIEEEFLGSGLAVASRGSRKEPISLFCNKKPRKSANADQEMHNIARRRSEPSMRIRRVGPSKEEARMKTQL